jgi:hypothetical protein
MGPRLDRAHLQLDLVQIENPDMNSVSACAYEIPMLIAKVIFNANTEIAADSADSADSADHAGDLEADSADDHSEADADNAIYSYALSRGKYSQFSFISGRLTKP